MNSLYCCLKTFFMFVGISISSSFPSSNNLVNEQSNNNLNNLNNLYSNPNGCLKDKTYQELELRRQEMLKEQEKTEKDFNDQLVRRLAADNQQLKDIEDNFNKIRQEALLNEMEDIIVTSEGDRTFKIKNQTYTRFPFRNPINYEKFTTKNQTNKQKSINYED